MALLTNYFPSFTLARREELVLSGHDDALWLRSVATLIASCLQTVGRSQTPRGSLLPNAAAWSALGVFTARQTESCKFGVVASCGFKGLKKKNLPMSKSLVYTYSYVQLNTPRTSSK